MRDLSLLSSAKRLQLKTELLGGYAEKQESIGESANEQRFVSDTGASGGAVGDVAVGRERIERIAVGSAHEQPDGRQQRRQRHQRANGRPAALVRTTRLAYGQTLALARSPIRP